MKRLIPCLFLVGCATIEPFPQPDSSWETSSGQLQYITPERSLIAEFISSRHDTDFRLDVSKGGALPLVRVARHGDRAHVEGAMARGSWTGRAADAPGPLRGWVVEVPRAFESAARSRAARMDVPGGKPGEKFVFIFNR